MPKLPEAVAKSTAAATLGNGMEEGIYEVVLTAVAAEKNGQPLVGKESGTPYWVWEISFPEDANESRYKGRKIWTNVSLGDGEMVTKKRLEVYNAFGASTDIDTDELVERGARCLVQVRNVPDAYNGPDAIKAEIRKWIPLETTTPVAGTKGAAAKGAKASKELF